MLVADARQNEPSGYALLAASTKKGSGSMPAMRMSRCFHSNPTKYALPQPTSSTVAPRVILSGDVTLNAYSSGYGYPLARAPVFCSNSALYHVNLEGSQAICPRQERPLKPSLKKAVRWLERSGGAGMNFTLKSGDQSNGSW